MTANQVYMNETKLDSNIENMKAVKAYQPKPECGGVKGTVDCDKPLGIALPPSTVAPVDKAPKIENLFVSKDGTKTGIVDGAGKSGTGGLPSNELTHKWDEKKLIETAVANIPSGDENMQSLAPTDPYRIYLRQYFEDLAKQEWTRQPEVIARAVKSILLPDEDDKSPQ